MGTSIALRPSVRSAFAGLIDYAGLFPPARLSLARANDEYRQARAGSHAWMLGRFIIPLPVLASSPHVVDAPFSAIVDGGGDSQRWTGELERLFDEVAGLRAAGVAIEALEIPLPAAFSHERTFSAPLLHLRELLDGAGLSQLSVYLEIARSPQWRELLDDAMAAVASVHCGAKLRCGGLTAQAFPTVDEAADFVAAAQAFRVPFKATAGLHHPFRHLDRSTGFTMHGFVNLLIAAALAPGADLATLRHALAEEDAGAVAFDQTSVSWRDRRITLEELALARNAFVAYGSCSFSEPIEDLTALGLLTGR